MPNWIGFADATSAYSYSTSKMAAAIKRWKDHDWDKKGYETVVRIPFMFYNYSFAKLDALIALVRAQGWKCYLDNHPWRTDTAEPLIGSPEWLAAWDVLSTHYANNLDVFAYEPINETYAERKHSSVTTVAGMQAMLHTLAHKIWEKDKSKYILMCNPDMAGTYSYDYNDMNDKAILTIHPYGYKKTMSNIKSVAASRFTKASVASSMPKFNNRIYVSEIEGTTDSSPAIEKAYLTEIINQSFSKGGGFCLWRYEQALDDGGVAQDDALASVSWPSLPPPQPTQYTLTMQPPSGSGTTKPPAGVTTYTSGSIVSLNATPAVGWKFNNWFMDDVTSLLQNPAIVTMDTNHSVLPIFTSISPPADPCQQYINIINELQNQNDNMNGIISNQQIEINTLQTQVNLLTSKIAKTIGDLQ